MRRFAHHSDMNSDAPLISFGFIIDGLLNQGSGPCFEECRRYDLQGMDLYNREEFVSE